MTSIKLLTEFWKTATFHDFSAMYKRILPGTGEDYHREKYQLFRDNLSMWLCDLTSENLQKVEGYLKARNSIDRANEQDLKFSGQLMQFDKGVLAEFIVGLEQDQSMRQRILAGLASIQDIYNFRFTAKKIKADPVAAEPTGMTNHHNSN